jgi:hypothetical protein
VSVSEPGLISVTGDLGPGAIQVWLDGMRVSVGQPW